MPENERISYHFYAPLHLADDFIRCGWVPEYSIAETYHGIYCVHMVWLCQCPIPNPKTQITVQPT